MKHYLFIAICFLAFTKHIAQISLPKRSGSNTTINFTENKGQFSDQSFKPRPDVLFGGSLTDMDFFIKNNGVSYQLKKVESYKDKFDQKQNIAIEQISKFSIYRIDLNWKGCNPISHVLKNNELEGSNNFYTEVCPNGVFGVKKYKDIIIENIYNNINLHYYEKNGNLKYDYILAPHANYKQIQIEVKGAEITLQKNGSILLKTPFGEIEEGAPLVFQSGKILKSEWIIKENILSFNIEAYDEKKELIIDPATRVWGTYYGGSNDETNEFCSTDSTGFVYTTGQTQSSNLIATTGAHQVTLNGTADAYLVKFSPSGTLKWGTYYGGSGSEIPYSCKADKSGNIYMGGYTSSINTSQVIATTGAYQNFYAGGGDGFLVKFDSLGVRQWGTYYGGASSEDLQSINVDLFGNVCISGITNCNCSLIATAGAHQTTLAGQNDCFLAKFNSTGSCLWATYYGGTNNELLGYCTTDGLGNVYLAGATNSSNNIATAGSHQPLLNTSPALNAFLVKFNSAGVRQWGTYYGGASDAKVYACAADKIGNIVIAGTLLGNLTPTAIATTGCHQASFGSGGNDGFLARFNTLGQRQWGSYYGGNGIDNIVSCAIDTMSNIFISGTTTSSNNHTSAGNHQTIYAGAQDAFLAKFSPFGVRQFGTYYGGPGAETGEGCAADNYGNVYLTGNSSTNSGTTIATSGSYQSVTSSTLDAFVAKFNLCSGNSITAGLTSTLACSNQTVKVSATGADTYMLLPGNIAFSSTVIITPTASTIYTVNGSINGCGLVLSTPLTMSINPLPIITASNATICLGSSHTITPAGAVTYTYTGGGPVVSPTLTSSYTITGTDANGCISNPATVSTVTVIAPTISVNSGSICSGQTFTMNPSGAVSYTFSGGNAIVSPTANTAYTVTGTDASGCVNFIGAVSNVTVGAIPVITVSSGSICEGQSYTMIPGGASTYTFLPAGAVVSPTINSSYTVTGTSALGCVSSSFAVSNVTVNVRPIITSNSGSICSGQSFTIIPAGANTYTFSGGSAVVNPAVTTSYSVTGTNTLGCNSLLPAISNVTVLPSPSMTLSTSSNTICAGESATLTVNGAISYTWGSGGINTTEIITPSVTTNYSVTGIGSNGCTSSGFIIQYVDACLGIITNNVNSSLNVFIYPNPNNGEFIISTNNFSGKISIEIYNALGQIIRKQKLIEIDNTINVSEFANGIYHVNIYHDNLLTKNIKIIKE